MIVAALTSVLGGVGLLLLGMNMMTDGLKLAAGNSLRVWLARSTATRLKAAMSGFAITALVQSSGAVTVATLGFTNAGIISLRQAAWVVFGSNVGTTMTAWIVALIGLRLQIDAVALPIVGIGILLHLFAPEKRLGHSGTALAGFGLLFMGLDLLQAAFADVGSLVSLDGLRADSLADMLLVVIGGMLLTTIMQSSSASLAIILTAASQGIVPPLLGAAMVIGANLGSTSTALIATIGATAGARRLSMIHVVFNLVTAVVAFVLLVPLWWLTSFMAEQTHQAVLATQLAIFHTLFNLIGLLLMCVLADRLIAWVEGLFQRRESRPDKPQYLDETVLAVPELALAALHAELLRIKDRLVARSRLLLASPAAEQKESGDSISELLQAANHFSGRLGRAATSSAVSERLLDMLQAQYECKELRELLHQLSLEREALVADQELFHALSQSMDALYQAIEGHPFDLQQAEARFADVAATRQWLRAHLLNNQQTPGQVAHLLSIIGLWERVSRQLINITELLQQTADQMKPEPAGELGEQASASAA